MTRILCLCGLALGLFGLVLATPQPADAGCYKLTATTKGALGSFVAGRATRQVKRAVKRGGYAMASPVRTSCSHNGRKHCTAWVRACK